MKARTVALVLLLVLPLGCAPTRFSPEEARANFGKISVAATDTQPTISFDRPATSRGEAAGAGALGAGLAVLQISAQIGVLFPPFFLVGLALSPFAAAGGAIGGAVAPRPSPEEVEQAVGVLENAVGKLKIQEILRQRVILRLTEVERYPDVVADKASTVEVGAAFNTVIEVGATEVSLKGRATDRIDPSLRLKLHVDVRVVRGGSTERSRRIVAKIVAEGDGHTLLEWAADEAKRFRDHLTSRELEKLAEKIVDEVFLRPTKETSGKSENKGSALGLTIRPPSLLLRADQVIE